MRTRIFKLRSIRQLILLRQQNSSFEFLRVITAEQKILALKLNYVTRGVRREHTLNIKTRLCKIQKLSLM